jgi:hypothetical protein
MFESLLVGFQHRSRLPDSFIEKDETITFLEFLCPGICALIPTRRQLGGPILRRQAGLCRQLSETKLKNKWLETGGRLNLLSDVWENIARQHLLGSQLLLFGCLLTFSLDRVVAQHHGIAIARDLEALIEKAIASGWIIL